MKLTAKHALKHNNFIKQCTAGKLEYHQNILR